MPKTSIGRCPDCGEAVVTRRPRPPGTISLHGCPSRVCHEPGCEAKGLTEAMVRVESGEWYCPSHALLLAARDLVALYRADGEADWTAISEIIAEVLPEIVTKIESQGASLLARAHPAQRRPSSPNRKEEHR